MPSAQTQVIDVNATNSQHLQRGAQFSPRGPEIATTLYAGLFSAKPGGYLLWNVPDWNAFVAKWNEVYSLNLRLVSIDTGQEDASTTWYFGAWNEMTGECSLYRTPDWTVFMTQFRKNAATMRLLDFDIHVSAGSTWFTGTWGGTPIQQTIVSNLNWADFSSQWKTLSDEGKRLTRIQVFPTAHSWNVTGLFEEGTNDGYALVGVSDWASFYSYYQNNQKTLQLVDFQVFDDIYNSTRWYFGVWRQTSSAHQFIFDQDWGSFVNQMNELGSQGLLLQKAVLYPNQIEVPEPQWAQVFDNALGQSTEGYVYHVLHNGQTVAQGVNHARASQDPPETTWTLDTRVNLASVSKSITAVAVMKLLSDYDISLDAPFYPLVKTQFPTVGPGVDTVTIRNLLQMKSGMVPDPTLEKPIWPFLAEYLAQQNVPAGAPGNVEEYSNTNFTILQAIIDTVTGHVGETPDYYVTYVSEKVLTPMGINLAVFNPNPDPQSSATLYYINAADTTHGFYWSPFEAVAAGGWVSSANELAKFLTGVRNNVVLSSETTQSMLNNNLGWYTYDGIYGPYFHHNGGFLSPGTPPQGLVSGIIHLSNGYDALIVVNSTGPNTIGLMIQAFETRAAAAIAATT